MSEQESTKKTSRKELRVRTWAVKASQRNENLFRALFEGSIAPMVLVEPDTGRIVRANRSAVGFYGYPLEELTSLTVFDINMSPGAEIRNALAAASRKESSVHIFRHRLACGGIRTVEVHGSPIEIDKRTFRFSIVHDISDRERIEDDFYGAHAELEKRFLERTADLSENIAALRESEKRYRLLFENMLAGLAYCRMVYDGQGRPADYVHLAVNEAFGRLTGLEDVIGRRVSELIPGIGETHPELFEMYGRVASSGQAEEFEIEIKPLGRWFSLSAYSTEQGFFVAVFANITERKTSEELLRRYEILAGHSRDIILFMRLDNGRILEANHAARLAYGYTRQDLLGLMIHDLRAPGSQGLTLEQMRQADLGGILFESVHRRRDGSTFPVEVSSQGATIFGTRTLISVVRDITERKQAESVLQELYAELEQRVIERTAELTRANAALVEEIEVRRRVEEALRKSEARYRALFENSMDAIFLTVPDGATRAANRAACEMFGMTEEELVRAGRQGISNPADGRLSAALEERARNGRIFCELDFIRKDGTRFPCETSSCIVEDGSSSFVMLRDITSRRQAEETLRNYTRRLIEIEEELRKKLAAELHDQIGRDLTALGINCSIISDSLADELRGRIGRRIEDSRRLIEEVTRTVRNLMNNLRPPMLDDYGLGAALRWYGDHFSGLTGIAVRILVDKNCPRLAVEKETALFRIAQEALTNTAKHAAARNLTVTLGCSDGIIRLAIADDGRGFDPGALSTAPEGPGWGLTIMRERAELFGGSFTLDSRPGQGTSVTVEIREEQ